MTLQDIYDQLSFGELRLLFLGEGGEDTDTTEKVDFKRLLPTVVLGLTDLHTRFRLKEGRTSVTLVPNQASYFLTENDLLKVEQVSGTWCEDVYDIPLNVRSDKASILTPSFKSLLVPTNSEDAPWLLETPALSVVYRQDHPPIDPILANVAPTVLTIDLPHSHLQALLLFIASRIYNPVGMNPGAMHEGNNFKQLYEVECQRLTDLGLEIDDDEVNDRLERNGWV